MLLKINKLLLQNKLLLLILAFSAFLRFYSLDTNPPALNWDEISHGYNAYSILRTGKDEWDKSTPLIFRAYGDYKLPVYIYLTSLSELFFGLNVVAVRTASVLAGLALVLYTYLLTKELLDQKDDFKKTTALLASLLVAVEPWSLFLSRGAFEANLAQAMVVAGIYYFLRGLKNPKSQIISIILFGLSVWTYNSERIFVPLLLTLLFTIYNKKLVPFEKKIKPLLTYILLLILFFLPMFLQLLNPSGQARYGKVAIIDEGAVNRINEQRNVSNYPPFIERLLYNKVNFFVTTFFSNWIKHYSPSFLFINGGDQYQYNVQDYGLLYIINLPFFLIGIAYLIRESFKKKRYALLIVTWMLLAPVPASLTRDSPHTLRAITMLPLPMIFSALGLYLMLSIIKQRQKKSILIIYTAIVGIFLYNYVSYYFGSYRKDYSWSWQYGYKQTVEYAKDHYDEYDKIIYTKKYGEPHIFVLFYWPWDPSNYRNDEHLVRFEQSDWYWVDRFDKFYFVNDWDIPTRSDLDFVLESGTEFDCDFTSCLLITSPGTHQQDWDLLKTIYFLDGKPAFEILDNRK